jgi:hypothetical protein
VFGARRTGVGGGIGWVGEIGVLLGTLYRAGRLAEAAEERSRWWPMQFNRAAVLSLESAPRERGNGWAALSATAADRMGGGGAASDRRRETKEERAEWAAKARWAG